VAYDQVDLLSSVAPGQYFDIAEIDRRISADPSIRVLHIQRSCGYQWRPSIPVAEIGHVIAHIRAAFPGRELVVFVDNCYGEFVEDLEPTHVGADLVAGSLIKVRKSVIWIRVVGGSAAAGRGRGTEGSGPN
jgi:cystathionine beta-lyase family protein involved in aluminum resistance